MLPSRLVLSSAMLCLIGLAMPARAASPTVIPGIGPDPRVAAAAPAEPGRYGGGFIEFLMTGQSRPAGNAMRAAPPRYVASVQPGEPQPDYGFEPPVEPGPGAPLPQRPVPGYAAPRKAPNPLYLRQEVAFSGGQKPGTVVIDTANKFLYLVEGGGQAMRYGIGVGRPGFLWSGEKVISRKAEWPDWTPPAEMLQRRPDLPLHMEGGISNPLGARAMYLGSSLYRIHGTNEPDTIGTNVSSGCIRLTNDDVADLYSRVNVGTHVIVM